VYLQTLHINGAVHTGVKFFFLNFVCLGVQNPMYQYHCLYNLYYLYPSAVVFGTNRLLNGLDHHCIALERGGVECGGLGATPGTDGA